MGLLEFDYNDGKVESLEALINVVFDDLRKC